MEAGQVRLDSEVADELQQRADASGRSLSVEANAWLRRALGLAPGQLSPAALAHLAPGVQPASISAPKGPAPLRAAGVVGRARPQPQPQRPPNPSHAERWAGPGSQP